MTIENPFLNKNFIELYKKSFLEDDFECNYIFSDKELILKKILFGYSNYGNSLIFDYLATNYSADDILNMELKEASYFKPVVYLKRFYTDQKLREGVRKGKFGFSSIYLYARIPTVKCSGTYTEYLSSLKKKFRGELNNYRNKLTKDNRSFSLDEYNNLDRKSEIFDSFVQSHLQRQESKEGGSILGNASAVSLIRRLLEEGEINLSVLFVDSEPASFILYFRTSSVAHSWVPTFRPMYSKYGIGKVHHLYLIKSFFEDSCVKEFSFMGGEEKYKLQFSNKFGYLYNILNVKRFITAYLHYFVVSRLRTLKRGVKKFIKK